MKTSFATIGNKPSMRRGPPRVPAGVHGRSSGQFSALKIDVFSRFSARFCAEKVLRWPAQTSLLESNIQLPEIRIHIPITERWKLEVQNPTSTVWKLEFEFQLLTPGTWFSTSTLWKTDSNFPQPTSGSWKVGIGNPTSTCCVFRFYTRFCAGEVLRRLVALTC